MLWTGRVHSLLHRVDFNSRGSSWLRYRIPRTLSMAALFCSEWEVIAGQAASPGQAAMNFFLIVFPRVEEDKEIVSFERVNIIKPRKLPLTPIVALYEVSDVPTLYEVSDVPTRSHVNPAL